MCKMKNIIIKIFHEIWEICPNLINLILTAALRSYACLGKAQQVAGELSFQFTGHIYENLKVDKKSRIWWTTENAVIVDQLLYEKMWFLGAIFIERPKNHVPFLVHFLPFSLSNAISTPNS